ncbi:quinone oxidoreductase family protein [Companilactobacillus ginsenosidimutans]|uniref:Dehydrogenase n=1 Tax=Companilactobacillus ginsenosidimutans TaxID=1007676 RepID=A0A0H4QFC3_9LACO|nr:alcohol dehydrogenase catalytic domain-containing protein [Companilactobacillus ginsenosidimutans]AKP66652.1 dehydrogenase [Companilactobacillus ginsenosidimutans]
MKAAYIEKTGSPENIIIGDLLNPVVNPEEVLVKVEAVSVNHADTFVRSGAFKTGMNFPFVLGRDAVGTVEQLGKKVTDFQIGDKVWTNSMGYDGRQGTTSELISVPINRLYKIPTGVDMLKLVATVHSSATAVILLNDVLQVESGKNLLIEGAAGHVGTKLASLGILMGLNITTTSSPDYFQKIQNLGVTDCRDYHENISDIHSTFDYIVDTSGRVSLEDNLDNLKLGGKIGLITAPSSNKFTFSVRDFYMNLKAIQGFVISHATVDQLYGAAQLINKYVKNQFLLDDDILTLPFSEAAQAHKMLEGNTNHKQRIILTF